MAAAEQDGGYRRTKLVIYVCVLCVLFCYLDVCGMCGLYSWVSVAPVWLLSLWMMFVAAKFMLGRI